MVAELQDQGYEAKTAVATRAEVRTGVASMAGAVKEAGWRVAVTKVAAPTAVVAKEAVATGEVATAAARERRG